MKQGVQHLPDTGERLKALRLKCGLSQRGLSELVEVNHSTISRWEGEQSFPNSEQFAQLAEIFGEPLESLVVVDESASESEERVEALKETILGLARRVSQLERLMESSQSFYLGVSTLTSEVS